MLVSVKNHSGLKLEKSRTRVKAGRSKQYTGTVRLTQAGHSCTRTELPRQKFCADHKVIAYE